ncbi:glycerate kinase [Phycicoccus endophyticus]|uniref:Glycerate kinase n=1 Tax=Phycicoccus endophyticus TaxID=1690220 RepID=A0A7G9R506_9MICO|nr:glycerate kinase [Phycicoccus endophyticus]NHI20930.1 glycerate kinase [Phycicoccus endophyticus]QNN50681.1 glycerate kinase [Phycicoccus endophyticus]GGL22391.1 glycerate kinase [Phycicoccus endophyticus]
MRVLIAPDAFGDTLGPVQTASALAEGWGEGAPHDQLRLLPLSDGGPGFLDVLERALGGTVVATTVSDPLGREVPAAVLVVEEEGRRTAYVEAAQAAGLHLLSADERDPGLTSTWGVGQLLEAALAEGAERVVVGLGGGSTNDAGAGLLAALGAGPPAALARGGLALRDAAPDALAGAGAVLDRLAGVELVIATDDTTPLLGLSGTSAASAPGKGASAEQAQELESALGHFTEILHRVLPTRPLDLATGAPRRLDREPGAGACGGLGYALLLLGARQVGGVAEVLRVTGFDVLAAGSDLVVTATGRLDWATLRGSVVSGVAESTLATGRPCVAVAGEVLVGRRETMSLGLAGCYAVADHPREVEALVADPVGTLAGRVARVARTWSPAR